MNRALTATQRVSDIGTYERMCGIHLSLGAKHGVFDKPERSRRSMNPSVESGSGLCPTSYSVIENNGAFCGPGSSGGSTGLLRA